MLLGKITIQTASVARCSQAKREVRYAYMYLRVCIKVYAIMVCMGSLLWV